MQKVARFSRLVLVALAASLAAAPATGQGTVVRATTAHYDDAFRAGDARSLAVFSRAPSDPLWSQAWSLRALGLPAVWPARAAGSANTIVAVVDTGVEAAHPDLVGALVPGHDSLGSGTGTEDDNGHGTAVAGIVAARSDNNIGVASACDACSVMPVKVIGAGGTGDSAHIADGIVWAVDHGARVINLSVVLDAPEQDVAGAVRYARDHGVVVVAAAGNGGASSPTYPAAYDGVIGVAASQEDGSLYPWSQRGPWVDVAAPGCTPSTARGGGYTVFCGTSSATAAASGTIGLALSLVPAATSTEVEQAITSTARPLSGGGVASGLIDAASLVDALRTAVAARG